MTKIMVRDEIRGFTRWAYLIYIGRYWLVGPSVAGRAGERARASERASERERERVCQETPKGHKPRGKRQGERSEKGDGQVRRLNIK